MATNNNRKKCTRCKVNLPSDSFSVKRADILYKHCDRCRENSRKYRENNKCEHGRRKCRCKECGGIGICEHNKRKSICKECGGSSICEHNRRKNQCKDCGGSQICEHDKQKSHCKECMTHEERIKFIIKEMVRHSRDTDKKKDRYDPDNFVDKPFLEELFENNDKCHYCDISLTYNERNKTLATLDRKDNSIGHIKSNCVIACWGCNCGRGKETILMKKLKDKNSILQNQILKLQKQNSILQKQLNSTNVE